MTREIPPTRGLTRRKVLKISGAAMAVPLGVIGLGKVTKVPQPVQWHGVALGAQASLTLWHPNPVFAGRTIARMRTEVARLESVFSLYRPDSEIVQLNTRGQLAKPSRDLVTVLEEALRVASASGGAFDPTIQSLWKTYAKNDAMRGTTGETPSAAQISDAGTLTDYTALDVGSRYIGFARSGMEITLNGIAQGYITDRITDLLRNEGFDTAMVELGETRALGSGPDGQPFTINLVNPAAPDRADRSILLADAALSVSSGYGLRFEAANAHHIFDPRTGRSANRLRDVTVIAPRAIWADALSTAIFVAGEDALSGLLHNYPSARAVLTRLEGTSVSL